MLITAIVLAMLYFALMHLLLVDSSRQLIEAQRFRARIVAANLAENAAELAAQQILTNVDPGPYRIDDWQGTASAKLTRTSGTNFTIAATATTKGVMQVTSTVTVQGFVANPPNIRIEFTDHSQ